MNVLEFDSALPPALNRLRIPALIAGAVGWGVCIIAMLTSSSGDVYSSYLWSFLFFLGISLGSLAIIMMHRLTGGEWGFAIRRPAEAAALNVVLMAILFLPLLFGLHHLFPWAIPDLVKYDAILKRKTQYLNPEWFMIRAAIYFACWIVLALVQVGGASSYEKRPNPRTMGIMVRFSAGGLILYFFTMSLAGVDWVMSREAHWESTILGFLICVGQALSAVAFMIIILSVLLEQPPHKGVVRPSVLNDLGNLLMTLVILWAYMSLSQFLVTWMGNGQEEIPWYLHRIAGGWKIVAGALMLLHFFIPFVLLLVRMNKRTIAILWKIAAFVLVMRVVDTVWMIRPSDGAMMGTEIPGIYFTDFFAPLAVGGVWLFVFLWTLGRRPLLPQREPGALEMVRHAQRAPHPAA